MDVELLSVTSRKSEISGYFGGDGSTNGDDSIVATIEVDGDGVATAYLDIANRKRGTEEMFLYKPRTEEISTSFSTLDWESGDPVSVVVEDDGDVVFEEDITDRVERSLLDAKTEAIHENGSVEERLDNLQKRVSELEKEE